MMAMEGLGRGEWWARDDAGGDRIVTTRGKARPSRRLERRLYQCSPERAKVHPPTRRPLTVVAGSIVTGAVIGAADPALYIIMPLGYPAPPPRNHQ